MIYTVTVNPALDYVMQLKKVDAGSVNRSNDCQFLAGGKGINVSQILNQLDVDNTAWGFVGGFTGKELVRQLNVKKIESDFVTISDDTRVNVKVHAQKKLKLMRLVQRLMNKKLLHLRRVWMILMKAILLY